ncbi:GAP family protein [Mycolicibacterium sp. HK-90]|uniref:GAP family protein n=1 Tax=Mycolicibacterium sp. HK-90 TaxID=3056937 RepID=UPI00265A5BF7|nr:GAP family protein [Mycolicibacterium sp. HK-90]WKG02802.1 GAP family protein [Mycolicibacterium sp. HK-90]
MWGSLVVLALLTTINPVRLGIILLVLSRPRPVQNLLAYWAGAVLIGLASLVIPLIVLHSTPASSAFAKKFAHPTADPMTQRITIGLGVALLAIAAYMVVRNVLRKPVAVGSRQRTAGDGSGTTSTLVDDSGAPPAITRLLYSSPADDDADPKSRRLTGRIRDAWQNGSPWIPFVIGIIVVPPLDGILFALAIVVASGASFEVQLVALIVFVFGVLLVEEFILVSNLVAPARTQAALRKLHEWASAHRQTFAAAICAVVGASLVLRGMGGL